MATHGKVWSRTTSEPATKAEFYKIAGITAELAKFVEEFSNTPEVLDSLPLERQQQIEAQMDAVLSLFAERSNIEVTVRQRRDS